MPRCEIRNMLPIVEKEYTMKRTALLGILLFISTTSACLALGNKNKPQLEPASEKLFDFRQITLHNGLEVITKLNFPRRV